MKIRTMTLTQPWATLVAISAKRIETRSWGTRYRGPLAIHAARRFPAEAVACAIREPIVSALAAAGIEKLDDLPRAAIIAVCELVGCEPMTPESIAAVPEPERSFGHYAPGRYAWRLANVRPVVPPVPAKGALGLWEAEIPGEALRSVSGVIGG